MKGSYLQIILIFAIFLLPEIVKIFKKKNTKKYEYPDEQPYETPKDDYNEPHDEPQAPQKQPDLWDILTGRANYQQPEPQAVAIEEVVEEAPKPKKAEEQAAVMLQATPRSGVKLSAKSAARGLIMAEILGKPRALRPIERELPCRREYR